jgi:hypothetical protein
MENRRRIKMKRKAKSFYITKRFRIRVYGGRPTFLVRINKDIWEMDYHAHMPNGVCIYSGTIADFPQALEGLRLIPKNDIPQGIKTQVARIICEE